MPQLSAGAFPLQNCKRVSPSGSLVPIANCSIGNISYNKFGVRIIPKDPSPNAVTILYFASGNMASDKQDDSETAAKILHERLERLTKQPIRLIDASYEGYFTGESSLNVDRLLSEYKPRFTLVAYQNGIPVVKATEISLLNSQTIDQGRRDPERMLRLAMHSRSLGFSVFPKEGFLNPYLKSLKALNDLSDQHGSQFRLLWNGAGVHPRAWFYWRTEPFDWLKILIQPLLAPLKVSSGEFEQSLVKSGISYRWAPSTGDESTETFAKTMANALFTREDWSRK
jgi:hypothetical protein